MVISNSYFFNKTFRLHKICARIQEDKKIWSHISKFMHNPSKEFQNNLSHILLLHRRKYKQKITCKHAIFPPYSAYRIVEGY